MKNLFTLSIISLLLLMSCSDESNTQPAEIRISITGECIAEISIFNTAGKRLEQKTYNCQETQTLVFNIKHSGPLIIYAESGTKKQKEVITVAPGKTTQIDINLL
jgi:hypothetical protein